MKLLFSIILNGIILFVITYLLGPNPEKSIQAWIILGCSINDCTYTSFEALKTYIIGWVILWIINITIRPVLKILSLPLFFIFFGFVAFVVNGIILKLFSYIINKILIIPWVWYEINGWINFLIAVAIFTVLNMIYSLLISKK